MEKKGWCNECQDKTINVIKEHELYGERIYCKVCDYDKTRAIRDIKRIKEALRGQPKSKVEVPEIGNQFTVMFGGVEFTGKQKECLKSIMEQWIKEKEKNEEHEKTKEIWRKDHKAILNSWIKKSVDLQDEIKKLKDSAFKIFQAIELLNWNKGQEGGANLVILDRESFEKLKQDSPDFGFKKKDAFNLIQFGKDLLFIKLLETQRGRGEDKTIDSHRKLFELEYKVKLSEIMDD